MLTKDFIRKFGIVAKLISNRKYSMCLIQKLCKENDINMRMLELKVNGEMFPIAKIILGTDYFGTSVTKETSFKLMDMYTDMGGNCLDTARVYASWLPGGSGASENTLGKWLKQKKNRNKILISSKGGHPPVESMNEGRLTKKELQKDLEESLKTIGTDYIDIYWLHRDDIKVPVEELMDILNGFIQSGKIRRIGASNWSTRRIQQANEYANSNRLAPFMMSQIQWSLASSTKEAHDDPTIICMDQHEYQWYNKNQFPVMAYSSQAKGFFTKAIHIGVDKLSSKAYSRFYTAENLDRLERVRAFATKSNLTPTQVTLAYITCNSVPSVAIIGCKNEEQLADSLTTKDVYLTDAEVTWLYKD